MRKSPLLTFVLLLTVGSLFAGPGDTTTVQTFTFSYPISGGFYEGNFTFPSDTNRWEKILMYYTLKCDMATTADGYPCGEWDYLTYTYVYDSSGTMDSTYKSRSYFTVGTSSPDTFGLSWTPTWNYYQEWLYSISHTSTTSFDSAIVGSGSLNMNTVLPTGASDGRAQFLYKAAELSSAGLTSGDITGLRLNLSALGASVNNLRIKLKHSSLDSLTPLEHEESGFTEVYHYHKTFAGTGWNDLQFTSPFNWNGTDNIVVEFSFDRATGGTNNDVLGTSTAWKSGISTSGTDYYLDFTGGGNFVNLGEAPQTTGTNPRTIECWGHARSFNNAGLFQAGPTGTTGKDFSLRTRSTDNEWRVQHWGTPDYDATLAGSKDEWHHYAVTFDGTTSRLYYDGQFVTSEGVTLDTDTHDVWIGRWAGSYFNGKIDEVRLWDKALSSATIEAWHNKTVDGSHPDYADLKGYYKFDEGSGNKATDSSPSPNPDGSLSGLPGFQSWRGEELRKDFQQLLARPNVIFEQGVYTSVTDSTLSLDSTQKAPKSIVLYENPAGGMTIADDSPIHPSLPTDTLIVWEASTWRYTYDATTGAVVDSTWIGPDSIMYNSTKEWYSPVVVYEMGRFITPYGINLDLGPSGFTWVYDVTDYAPILHDMVRLRSGNNQELLDLKFVFIEGVPERDVIKLESIWRGSWSYRSMADGDNVTPQNIPLDPSASMYRIKTRTSGHGFGSGENCAEFCRKEHRITVDSTQLFAWDVWKECASNPVYPQGGTWIYDRAGWCPGTDTDLYNHELTSYVTPGDTISIDYGVEGYPAWGGNGNYVLAVQMVSYDNANHSLDAAIDDIIAPNKWREHLRFNPICTNPIVRIRNKGTTTIDSVEIHYQMVGGTAASFTWTGSLKFLETAEVELPLVDWDGSQNKFKAWVSNPNSGTDEYAQNDSLTVEFSTPPVLPNDFYLYWRTNGAVAETKYSIHDADGTLLYQNSPFLTSTTIYRDTFQLNKGCYRFRLWDTDGDGLSFFANSDGNGFARLRGVGSGTTIKEFEADFGNEIIYEFTVDTEIGVDEVDYSQFIDIYPNPTNRLINFDIALPENKDVLVDVFNLHGVKVATVSHKDLLQKRFSIDLEGQASGLYTVRLEIDGETSWEKIVLSR